MAKKARSPTAGNGRASGNSLRLGRSSSDQASTHRPNAQTSAKAKPAVLTPRYPETPGFKDAGAGREAAKAMRPNICRRRAEVLDVFDRLKSATPDEVAAEIGRPPHVTRPRASELFLLGELVKTGERRPSAFGSSQTVYRRATSEERALYAARKAAEAEHGSRQ